MKTLMVEKMKNENEPEPALYTTFINNSKFILNHII